MILSPLLKVLVYTWNHRNEKAAIFAVFLFFLKMVLCHRYAGPPPASFVGNILTHQEGASFKAFLLEEGAVRRRRKEVK